MRRKYNDLLAKRAGMLTEAESLLKAGKREDYRSKMTEFPYCVYPALKKVFASGSTRAASLPMR